MLALLDDPAWEQARFRSAPHVDACFATAMPPNNPKVCLAANTALKCLILISFTSNLTTFLRFFGLGFIRNFEPFSFGQL